MARRRRKLSRKQSRKNFRGNSGVHAKNLRMGNMRGGTRL